MATATLCASGGFDAQVARLRDAYRSKRDALHAALTEHLPSDCTWMLPGGGFFIWLNLPQGMNAEVLLSRAEALGTAFAPGSRFHIDEGGAETVRLAFSYYDSDQLAESAHLLGEAMRAMR
jgi:DNA-binding transcriptional MocR family regulator